MKKLSRLVATAAMTLTATAFMAPIATAEPTAGAVEVAPNTYVTSWDEEGNPTSGHKVIDADSANSEDPAAITPLATENVGGGTWNYGTRFDVFSGTKTCYSHYIHQTKTHTATAIMGEQHRVSQGPGRWANAEVTGGPLAGTCTTYWSTQ